MVFVQVWRRWFHDNIISETVITKASKNGPKYFSTSLIYYCVCIGEVCMCHNVCVEVRGPLAEVGFALHFSTLTANHPTG